MLGIEIGKRSRWPLDGFGSWDVPPTLTLALGGEGAWVEKRGKAS